MTLQKRAMSVALVNDLRNGLAVMDKEVSSSNQKMRTISKKTYNSETNIVPFEFHLGYYLIMHPANAWHGKLNARWIGPVGINPTKSDLKLVVKDLHNRKTFPAHDRQLQKCLAQLPGVRVNRKRLKHALYRDFSLQLINAPHCIRINDWNYRKSVSWLISNNRDNRKWKAAKNLKENMPGPVFKFLHSAGRRILKEKFSDLHFEWFGNLWAL